MVRESNMPIGVKLTLSVRWPDELGKQTEWYSEYPDATLEDILTGVVACLTGATFIPETIYQGMKEFAESNLE